MKRSLSVIALEFLRPQNVSQNREETWTVQFSSFELLEALLSGWNFTQHHPLRMDTVISNYTAGGLSWKRWPKLFAKLEGKRERRDSTTTARFGELLRFFHFFALHFLSFPFHWMNLLTLLKRPLLAWLTKFSWFKLSTLIV